MSSLQKIKLGIAPIAWTNDDLPDLGKENTFEQCISEMALAGFTGSEIGNKYPKDVKELKKALDLRGIKICNAWFSTFLTTKPYEETEKEFIKHISFLKELGADVVGVSEQGHSVQGTDLSVFDNKYVLNDKEWIMLCEGLNKLGKIAKDMGITLTFHHHMGTSVQYFDEIDKLMEGTDKEYVNLLFDTGHLAYCGVDPYEVAVKYKERIKHIHLKDIREEVVDEVRNNKYSFLTGVRKGTFTVPGDGVIDFEPIFKLFRESGYDGWMVVEAEQDPAVANPLEYAIKARKYINNKLGI